MRERERERERERQRESGRERGRQIERQRVKEKIMQKMIKRGKKKTLRCDIIIRYFSTLHTHFVTIYSRCLVPKILDTGP